ncbi:MAG: lipoate--protein ligase family protein [Xanthomonadales bacterium]|nr:lipoate--protein ligase family protein [Gammaproteobacteria bacterium]MBT8052988.1 lipoate--protein ligase family protein [Gammaproteobacteria bacterium]NND57880.1 lipoate--protein ligase family protein [Xanthomonadales bacterium]NNK50760.1 lipoate--protein ligase family protein [Xanthomonadales bacterium]
MEKTFRVLDTGVMEGRLNIALGQAIVEAHREQKTPDTLRFLRFPPTALVGRHQALAQEINLDYCREHDIGVARRITGGGAIFMEPGLLGWELAFHRKTLGVKSLPELTREICEAVADGISRLGVDARFRPRNDIEIDGRKVSGTGGFFDGDTLFYQGTVLVDMDPKVMVSALHVPQAKLEKRRLDSAAQRVVTLRELMGDKTPALKDIQAALIQAFSDRFGLKMEHGVLSDEERAEADLLYRDEIGTDEFVGGIEEPPAARGDLAGRQNCPGGTITSYLRLEGPAQNRVRGALITGDFFITPPRVVYDLESRLRGVYLDDLETEVKAFFKEAEVEVLSVSPDDFIASLMDALADK